MIKKIDISANKIAREVLKLQKASYMVEAELIDFFSLPPLMDSVGTLKNCEEEFWGYYIDSKIAGIISFKIENNTLDIYRVAVHPDHFNRGIATKLLKKIETFQGFNRVEASTAKLNTPAIKLYISRGFKIVKEMEVEDNLTLIQLEKVIFDFKPGDEKELSEMINRVFDQFVGYEYSEHGKKTFREFVTPEAILNRYINKNSIFVYRRENRIVGMIELKNNKHICLFFVDPQFHNQGIGKSLFSYVLNSVKEESQTLSVNSSIYAQSIYEKLGFHKTDKLQEKDGIKFIPMEISLKTTTYG